jgi:hypothetical protein
MQKLLFSAKHLKLKYESIHELLTRAIEKQIHLLSNYTLVLIK